MGYFRLHSALRNSIIHEILWEFPYEVNAVFLSFYLELMSTADWEFRSVYIRNTSYGDGNFEDRKFKSLMLLSF